MPNYGNRKIIHLDMDAFYAAVEVLDNPGLKGLPVIIGGTGNRGVVSTASYEAREFGVHSAQPITTARRLCPQGIYMPPRISRYKDVSDQIFEIFRRFTPQVEPLSLDEAFLDVTASTRLFGSPEEIAANIKNLVKKEIGLTVSAGTAPNKLIAKIASDMDKPDGLTIVHKDKVEEFLAPLPIGRLWGVGKATRKSLALLGVETFGDLGRLPVQVLEKKFGRNGKHLGLLARGIDDRSVETEREVKSIGAEDTFAHDIVNLDAAKREILRLTIRASRRLRKNGFMCRTITVKVKYNDFKQVTRSFTLGCNTDQVGEIYKTALELLEKTAVGARPVRLLGISLSGLDLEPGEEQPSLFDEPTGVSKGRGLDRAVDRISEKFGSSSIVPAALLEK